MSILKSSLVRIILLICFTVDLNDDCLLEILERMDLEDIAKMFLVSQQFNQLITKWPSSLFLFKSPHDGCRIQMDVYRQPPHVLDRFFFIFGDYIHTLILDDICMYIAIKIVGLCPNLRHLIIESMDKRNLYNWIALDFISDNTENLRID